jgi:hypothetical protein
MAPESKRETAHRQFSIEASWVAPRCPVNSREASDEALVEYSAAYADQAERDFALFKGAIRSGRLRTKPDKASGLDFLV